MLTTALRSTLLLTLAAGCLSACGVQRAPLTAQRPVTALVRTQGDTPTLARPIRATNALAYGHTVARQLDPKALFMTLVGSQIGNSGTPGAGGGWELQYLGGPVPAPAGAKNPYNQFTRRITVTITADGEADVDVTEQQGLPLGLSYMDNPMPGIDSNQIVKLAKKARPSSVQGPLERLVLSGQMGHHHLQRLVWRVGNQTQGAEPQLVLDATTGAIVERAGAQTDF